MARAAVVGAFLVALVGAGPAAARWGKPVRLSPSEPQSILPAQVAFSSAGQAAVAFTVQSEENPASSSAFVTVRGSGGGVRAPRRVPRAQQVLALTYAGPALELLTGSATGRACCATAGVVRVSAAGSFGSTRTLLSGLTGITDGQLVGLSGGGTLAAVSTQRGVWVSQTPASGGAFGATRRLSFVGSPADLAGTAVSGGGGLIAWTDAGSDDETIPGRILYAVGTAKRAPSRARVAVTAPAGHSIDELAVEPRGKSATVAWVESWFSASGAFHAVVRVRDLGGSGAVRTVSGSFSVASELAFAGDGGGAQVLAWDACSATGTCDVDGALRRAGGSFGAPRQLGASDPTQAPAAAISARGRALAGWISSGASVRVASASASGGGFGGAQTVTSSGAPTDLALAYGASGALAVWSDGDTTPSLMGAFGP